MKRSYSYQDIQKTFNTDLVTDYLSGFIFEIHAFGHQQGNPKAVCSNRITGDFELIYIIGGKSIINVSDNEYECCGGDVVLIPPFTLHSIQTPPDAPHDNFWIHFDVKPMHKQRKFTDSMITNGVHKIATHNEELITLYRMMEVETQQNQPGNMLSCNMLLCQVFLVLLRNKEQNCLENSFRKHSYNNKDAWIVSSSMEFISQNISKPIGIKELCGNLHISESVLYKAFSKLLCGSPNYFILQCKMKNAEKLMKSTSLTFKEISEALAFSSPYYFSNVFKRFYNMSPREYMSSFE